MQNTLQNALNFCTDRKSKNHPTKMLELFQNNNTSAQCPLGEHGPLRAPLFCVEFW